MFPMDRMEDWLLTRIYQRREWRARAGEGPPGAHSRLEGHPQAKLDQAWKIVLAGYLTKAGTGTTTGIRRSELRVIESIEEFRPELEPHTCRPRPNLVFLKKAKSKFL